jgi:hypothetical protein
MEQQAQPPVVMWFKVYAVALALLYVIVLALLPLVVRFYEEMEMSREEAWFFAIFIGAITVPFLIAYAAAPFLPRRPWVWIYDLVLIAGGFTSCCTLPFCIALLIFWLKPEVKEYFRRT